MSAKAPLPGGQSGERGVLPVKTVKALQISAGRSGEGFADIGRGFGCGKAEHMEKKKQKTAVALEYDPNDAAPKIIATGTGRLAERIIETAQEADVPIHEDSKLADTLSKLEIGEMIPPELYEVVAEILVFVDAMDKIKAKMEKSGAKI